MKNNCPRCHKDYVDGFCSQCGLQGQVIEKVYNLSRQLYNKALACANNKDLSKAKALLKKAVHMDKQFIQARNLLGLIEYGTGNLGEGLKQWQISYILSEQDKDDPSFQYIKEFFASSNKRKFEQYRSTLIMYNEALEHLNHKSEDLAIIKLKKAVHINPSFVDGQNLLAFCYMSTKRYDKAFNCINHVLDMDIRNEIALHYRDLINECHEPTTVDEAPKEQARDLDKISRLQGGNAPRRFAFNHIGTLVIGLVLGVLGYAFLFGPQTTNKLKDELATANAFYEEQLVIKDDEITTLNAEQDKLKETVVYLEGQEDKLKEVNKSVEASKTLLLAAQHYANENIKECVNTLLATDSSVLNNESKALYNALKDKTFLVEAEKAFKEGERLYKAKAYSESKPYYERALELVTDADFSEYCYYRIPRANKELGLKEEAIAGFVEYFKYYGEGSIFYDYAKGHYEQLTK